MFITNGDQISGDLELTKQGGFVDEHQVDRHAVLLVEQEPAGGVGDWNDRVRADLPLLSFAVDEGPGEAGGVAVDRGDPKLSAKVESPETEKVPT